MTRHVLIIGATGGAGNAFMNVCIARGWQVTALTRRPVGERPHVPSVTWYEGDALLSADVLGAAAGVDAIFHGANPPGYRNWAATAPVMLANSIAGARAAGARLLFPGNIYNFGPDAFPVLQEGAVQNPVSRKGVVRRDMEQMIHDAAADGLKAIILRAGDFFAPHAPGSWLSGAMVRPGHVPRSVRHPGYPGVGHAWVYLPDLAETAARLLEAEADLDPIESLHMAGHWFDDGADFARATARVAGLGEDRVKGFPWWIMRTGAVFVPLFRELAEMRYLWQTPIRLDNARLQSLIGAEPHTPLDNALRESLIGLGCLSEAAKPAMSGQAASAASTPAAT
ncbi:MAG: NAD-dependent epimerase/dehydratase family protein [Minwuia sp.]|nr:NAD-dependent epimerase/dehydratase family protein [Minwuia sp.]